MSPRRSGATLPLGLQGIAVSSDVGREDGILSWLVPIPDDRRGVRGIGDAGVSCGATDEARDQEGDAVVDKNEGDTEGARDQPNNDVRMAVEDGSGGGDDLVIDGPSSLSLSDPVCSLIDGSASTDAMIPNRFFTCVEVFKKVIR